MAEVVFNMGSKAQLAEGVTASATTLKLDDYSNFLGAGSSGDWFYAQLIKQDGEFEIVKVDVGGSSTSGLSVDRGQEGTTGYAWNAGTIIWQGITAATLGQALQKDAHRETAVDPNNNVTSLYGGEKIYRTDLQTWYKAVGSGTQVWKEITGGVWQEMGAGDPGTAINQFFVYKGDLFFSGGNQKLFQYGGDSSPNWTERAGSPTSGSAITGPVPTGVVTDDYIFFVNSDYILRWNTGLTSWTEISGQRSILYGVALQGTDYLLVSGRISSTSWYDYHRISTQQNFAGITGGGYGRVGIDGSEYPGVDKALIVGSGGYGMSLDSSQNVVNEFNAGAGVPIYSISADSTYVYFAEDDGELWRWQPGGGSPTKIISSPGWTAGARPIYLYYGSVNGGPDRLWCVVGLLNTFNKVYTYTPGGSAVWTEQADEPTDLGSLDSFRSAIFYNNTLYIGTWTDSKLYKFGGSGN